ncbi:unnamed protein product [Ceratitis capitata]|uniref:(Mediterranean fruit fly) hypothetical protein n=1 Tax=Ceratitis capitata TaxID=7213 RepID=A0A811URV4_CERCA|nr:unnamed protein product [Ceratitis capitata]
MDIKSEPYDDSAQPHPTSASPRYQRQEEEENQQQQQHRNEKDKYLLNTASALLLHQRQQCLPTLNEHQVADMQEQASVGVAVVSMLQQQQQHLHEQPNQSIHHQQHINLYNYETKSESGSSDILSRPQSPAIHHLFINVANMHGNNMGPPKNFQSSKSFDKNSPSSQFDTNSNSSNASSTSSGKRANRTRFTDYQIKVLQEFFENNSYPKDSDLEYLSKLLLLSTGYCCMVSELVEPLETRARFLEKLPDSSPLPTSTQAGASLVKLH